VVLMAIEGVDGVGKTTFADWLAKNWIRDREVVVTHEPFTSFFTMLDGYPTTKYSDWLGYLWDREMHINMFIKPNLDEGKDVITDRYYWSTLVYQSHVPFDLNLRMNRLVMGRYMPDIVILLLDDPEAIHERKPELEVDDIIAMQTLYKHIANVVREKDWHAVVILDGIEDWEVRKKIIIDVWKKYLTKLK